MTTIILGLSALSIVLGYMVKGYAKTIDQLTEREEFLHDQWDIARAKIEAKHESELKKEKENWRQTSSAWILEKEETIEKLEQEKFDQMHELALMLNEAYTLDKIDRHKVWLHDFMLHNANRNQRRQFIDKGYINL